MNLTRSWNVPPGWTVAEGTEKAREAVAGTASGVGSIKLSRGCNSKRQVWEDGEEGERREERGETYSSVDGESFGSD